MGDYTLYILHLWIWIQVPADDTTFITFTNIPVISTFPYFEDFEEGTAGWTQYGISSSWELGSPSAAIISGASPATRVLKTPGLPTWTAIITAMKLLM